jgi:hypothetical protein
MTQKYNNGAEDKWEHLPELNLVTESGKCNYYLIRIIHKPHAYQNFSENLAGMLSSDPPTDATVQASATDKVHNLVDIPKLEATGNVSHRTMSPKTGPAKTPSNTTGKPTKAITKKSNDLCPSANKTSGKTSVKKPAKEDG